MRTSFPGTAPDLETLLIEKLAVLKRNRDHVPLDVLKTKYKKGYEKLSAELRDLTEWFLKSIILEDLQIFPEYLPEVTELIQAGITNSGLLKECSKAVFQYQDFSMLKELAYQLKNAVTDTLTPYFQQHLGLYIAPECLEEPYPPPYFYNLVTGRIFQDGRWVNLPERQPENEEKRNSA